MDWTDRHCRAFHRSLTRRARLYTEMITAAAIIKGDRLKLLDYDAIEHPLALQLGGSDPRELAQAAAIAEDFGYAEINLNVGCPSDRVQSGRFGACLMREPDLVAECMAAIADRVSVPATVKCRIGVDDQDPEDSLFGLVEHCRAAGVTLFIVHARKAWLQGLSPKENREVPPLDYDLVRRVKQACPDLQVILNGGLETLEQAEDHLQWADGVMFGRAAYHNPGLLGAVDQRLFGEGEPIDPFTAIDRHRPYLSHGLRRGVPLQTMTRPMIGLFAGRPGARRWRRILTVEAVRPGAGLEVLERAVAAVRMEEAGKVRPSQNVYPNPNAWAVLEPVRRGVEDEGVVCEG